MTDDTELLFEISAINTSDRSIAGVAHVETVDKDKEVILIKAIEEALPDFMELPILTVDHQERAVGLITKAWIDGSELHIEAKLKSTPDVDDVWRRVQRGMDEPASATALNSFSIKGIRKAYSRDCMVPTEQRTSPCITKGINLWAITLCGSNARNPLAFFDVVKAFAPELAEEFPPTPLVKMTVSDTLAKPECIVRKDMADTESQVPPEDLTKSTPVPEVEKSDDEETTKCGGKKKAVTKAAVLVESMVAEIDYGGIFAKALAEQMPELAKAQAEAISTFAKAQDEKFDARIDEITKAIEAKVEAKYEERLKTLEDTKVRLGPTVVMKAGKPVEVATIEDPHLANLAMITKAKGGI